MATVMKQQSFADMNILLLTSHGGDAIREDMVKYDIETFYKPFDKNSFFAYLIKKMID